MDSQPLRIEVPFRRLAWLTAAFFTPASISGWLRLVGGDASAFPMWFLLAALVTIVLMPLSWSDHSNTNTGKGLLGCLGFPAVLTVLMIGAVSLSESGGAFSILQGTLAATVFYLSLTLAMALANPEGLTLLLVLVNAGVATGLGLACAPRGYPHMLVLTMALGAVGFGAGLFASLVRGAARPRIKSEGL